MDEILSKLSEGARRYQEEVHRPAAAFYGEAASKPQKPHTLIVACADSRVHVEAITRSAPGDIFVSRNVGNMVPPHGETSDGVSAVIEYAVNALGVKHIAVCGHSDCGAMKALLSPHSTDTLPAVRAWLHNGTDALAPAQRMAQEQSHEPLPVLTEQNVLLQLSHLRTHPVVRAALERNELSLSGWVYDIASGVVRIASGGSQTFTPVNELGREAR